MLRDDSQIMDFIKMSIFMNGSGSTNTFESIVYIIILSCTPYIIDYIKQLNISWNFLQFRPKYTLLIEGKRSLRASNWCFNIITCSLKNSEHYGT